MFWVAILLLLGRGFDLYLLVQPGLLDSPQFGIWEIAPLAVALPLAVFAFRRAFSRASPVPRQDPMLAESAIVVTSPFSLRMTDRAVPSASVSDLIVGATFIRVEGGCRGGLVFNLRLNSLLFSISTHSQSNLTTFTPHHP